MSHTNRNSGTHFFTLSAYNRFRRLTSPRSDSSISDAESVQSSQAEEQEVEDVKGKKTAEEPLKVVDRVHMKTDRKVELLTPLPPLNAEEKIFFSLSEYNRFLHRLMSPRRSDSSISDAESIQSSQAEEQGKSKLCTGSGSKETSAMKKGGQVHIAVRTFTFCEIAAATKNFRPECLLGEGGFGRVYKGRLESTGQVVAVKQLDRNRLQGNREFLVEVLMLSLLHHPNLINLIAYCADGDHRLLVYEFMPLGSLEDHLHDIPPDEEPLDWNTRMKIAAGAAKGLEYMHDKANPPVIYRDFKSSNILLDEGFHPKLSNFGLAKLGPVGDKTYISTRVMGTYGYCAPEYAMTGQLTLKSDVYSFGVVFLELITGRKAVDNTRAAGEQNLVAWARPLIKDRRKFAKMADPLLQGRYPMRGLYQAVAVAAMCLQEQATTRPLIGDVVASLSYLASQTDNPSAPHSN